MTITKPEETVRDDVANSLQALAGCTHHTGQQRADGYGNVEIPLDTLELVERRLRHALRLLDAPR